jgi:putative ABC transport system ATP-binding protein
MIKLKGISKVFNTGKPNEFTALDGIDLLIEDKKATVLRGPSGSGKTTLLSIIGSMARPSTGRIWLDEREITSLPERFLTEIRRKTFGFVFQQFNLLKGITALENTILPAYPLGVEHRAARAKALWLFEHFGILDKVHSEIGWLSGGEAQRVAIIRALINDPSIIIADEPTAHLDTSLSRDLIETLGTLKKEGKTLILSSHDPLVCESEIVDRVVNIRDGRII